MISGGLTIAAAFLAVSAGLTIRSVQDGEKVTAPVTMPKALAEACKTTQCAIMTKEQLEELVNAAMHDGAEHVRRELDSNGCIPGRT